MPGAFLMANQPKEWTLLTLLEASGSKITDRIAPLRARVGRTGSIAPEMLLF